MRKILVTGYSGFVAGSVIAQAPSDWEVHAVGRSDPPRDSSNLKHHRIDLTKSNEIKHLFDEFYFDSVIHAAAIANIDFCEKNNRKADEINVNNTEILVNLCREYETKFVFCSTDNVFDGEEGNYSEDAVVNPINYYAATKVRAEQLIQSQSMKWVVARISLVIGLPVLGRGNSYLSGLIERLQNGEKELAPENEIRTPIDVVTLGKSLLELAENDYYGTIHLAGNSVLTRCEMARNIAQFLDLSSTSIVATDSNAIAGRAPRPDDVSLDNSRANGVLQTPMLSLEEGLERTLNFSVTGGGE